MDRELNRPVSGDEQLDMVEEVDGESQVTANLEI